MIHVSLISVLDERALNWYKLEQLEARMSDTVLFGMNKDPEFIVLSFRGRLQCRMGEKQQVSIEVYPKFLNLNFPGK